MALLDSAPTKRAAAPACLVATALVFAACGSTTGSDRLNTAGLKSGQRALAANAAQANEIVGQGSSDLKRRLGALRGHPVVINQWASWCTSCRFELGFFDKASKQFRDRVAFLGLDSQDDRKDGATTWSARRTGWRMVCLGRGRGRACRTRVT
jgi:thiol-disulfide isomerase/thioredoxin